VAFRVEVEDRGEPGAGKNDSGTPDVYRIFIWIPTGTDKAAVARATAEDACCEKTSEQAIADAGTPDIQDGGPLIHGNIQIHPQIAAHIDECPPPDGNCLNVELP